MLGRKLRQSRWDLMLVVIVQDFVLKKDAELVLDLKITSLFPMPLYRTRLNSCQD